MDELERRLSSILTEMAEEVLPSQNAWAEHERRLAQKSRAARRRPAILAAAAAVAVALILVPFLVTSGRGGDRPQLNVVQPPTVTSKPTVQSLDRVPTPVYQPKPDEAVLTQPFDLVDEWENGRQVITYVYTVQRPDGRRMVCAAKQPASAGLVVAGTGEVCSPMRTEQPGKYVLAEMPVPFTQTPGWYVYVAARPIDRIIVKRGEGNLVTANYRAGCAQFTVFSVPLGSQLAPLAYSALGAAPSYPTLENG